MKKFTFTSTPTHGFLSVSHKDIPDELKDKISRFSYMTFTRVYLEEDLDARIFLDYLRNNNIPFSIKDSWCENETIKSFGNYNSKFLGVKIGDTVNLHNGERVKIIKHPCKNSSLHLLRENGTLYKVSKNRITSYLEG